MLADQRLCVGCDLRRLAEDDLEVWQVVILRELMRGDDDWHVAETGVFREHREECVSDG